MTPAARFLTRFPDAAAAVVQNLDPGAAADALDTVTPAAAAALLERVGPAIAHEIVDRWPAERARVVMRQMDPQALAPILVRLDPDVRETFVAELPGVAAGEVERFLSYPEESAGRLMDRQAPIFRRDTRVEAVVAALRARGRPDDQVVLVVDDDQQLLGTIATTVVALAQPHQKLGDLAITATPAVEALDHRDDVADVLSRHHLGTLPVVDVNGRPLGLLRHGALVQVVEGEATADMQTMVGASRDERALSPVLFAVRKRLPWLQINLATAFLAAAVVGLFESTIARFSVLAVLLPVVAGQSGNTGAQALAVTMRGLTLREIGLRHWLRVVTKESSVGLLNGLAVALVTVAGVYLWSGSAGLCLVIGLAMVLSMTMAGVAGAAVPLALTVARQDPAQSSSIVLTTVTDIVGFFSFLGLATLFASMLTTG